MSDRHAAKSTAMAPACFTRLVFAMLLLGIAPLVARADDDPPPPPPEDPGPGFGGILPAPVLPSGYIRDQHTIPWGVRQVFNTPAVKLGQSFTPSFDSIDWVAFVFQNTPQQGTPGPGTLRVSLYSGLVVSSGTLTGLLGQTDEVTIPTNTTSWLLFHFPESIALTPGLTYFLHVEQVAGYPSFVGGRLQNFYFGGGAFGYFGGSNLFWNFYDLNFAEGIIVSPGRCAGDANCDGAIDFFDIDPFVAALTTPGGEGWNQPCPWLNSDSDNDGDVDFFDIDPLIARLGEACP